MTINIAADGAIRANGGNAENYSSGSGSGGSINITTATLSGAGSLEASGGAAQIGGGGGRIWMDTPKNERFSDIRLKQANDAGASVLTTSCPYCITNFEESRLNLGFENVIEVKDITEILQEVI